MKKIEKMKSPDGTKSERNLPPNLFVKALREVVSELIYISETDAAVIPFFGTKANVNSAAEILRQTKRKDTTEVEERDFSEFFERLTTIKDWFRKEDEDRARGFLELRKLLENNLTEIKVYKLGRIAIDIYVVGIDSRGFLAGVRTKAVET